MASANMSFLPKSHVRIPFIKIFGADDAALTQLAQNIQSLRKPGSGFSLTRALQTGGGPPSGQGQGWRLCLWFITAGGIIVKICFEHVKENVDVAALAASCIANVQSPDGAALTALVRDEMTSQIYV